MWLCFITLYSSSPAPSPTSKRHFWHSRFMIHIHKMEWNQVHAINSNANIFWNLQFILFNNTDRATSLPTQEKKNKKKQLFMIPWNDEYEREKCSRNIQTILRLLLDTYPLSFSSSSEFKALFPHSMMFYNISKKKNMIK